MNISVLNPNLPKDCKTVIIGEKYLETLEIPLKKLGISTMRMPDNPNIDYPVRAHADMSALHAGGKCIFLSPQLRDSLFCRELIKQGMTPFFSDVEQLPCYPDDVGLNICIFGNKVICSKWSAPNIVRELTSKGYSIIEVKQGYSRCSVCIIDNNSIITADRGIAAACKSVGVDVLLITPGFISLDGYDYGFIGGASFKISSNRLAFTGLLDKHPDKNAILDFLSLHNIEPVYLTDLPIFDIGTAIPIIEKEQGAYPFE